MLIFFPFGGVIVQLIDPERVRHIYWFHAGVQMFGYCIFLGAAGVGVWMGVNFEVVSTDFSSDCGMCRGFGEYEERVSGASGGGDERQC